MDPDACLQELLELAHDERRLSYAHERMAELIEALDGWIRAGGFLPKRWASATTSVP